MPTLWGFSEVIFDDVVQIDAGGRPLVSAVIVVGGCYSRSRYRQNPGGKRRPNQLPHLFLLQLSSRQQEGETRHII